MVLLRTRNKITDFLMILAWASPFNLQLIYYPDVYNSASIADHKNNGEDTLFCNIC